MKIETMKVFICEYCGKMSKSRSAMLKHEASCRKNPNAISRCSGCSNLLCNDDAYYNNDLDEIVSCKELSCKIDGCILAPLKVKRMIHGKEIMSRCDRIMPSIAEGCPNYEDFFGSNDDTTNNL